MSRNDLKLQVLHNMVHFIRLKWNCVCLAYMHFVMIVFATKKHEQQQQNSKTKANKQRNTESKKHH